MSDERSETVVCEYCGE